MNYCILVNIWVLPPSYSLEIQSICLLSMLIFIILGQNVIIQTFLGKTKYALVSIVFMFFFLSRFSDVGCFYETRQEFKCIMLWKLNLFLFCLIGIHCFLHFILSPNLFLPNMLTKNEDLTSEAELSNWSKGTLRCSLVAQFGLLTCYLKVMLQMAFLCMCMDFVNGRDS